MNQATFKSRVDFFSYVVDVDINHVCPRVKRNVPNVLYYLRARDRTARVAKQIFEQDKFFLRERDCLFASLHGSREAIEFQIFQPQYRSRRIVGAAQQRADASGKFRERKRLEEAVVGSVIERADAIFRPRAGAQQQNSQPRVVGAAVFMNSKALSGPAFTSKISKS